MNATRCINGFSGKIIFRGKRAILGLKMAHPHNLGSALMIFLKFCTMEGAKSYIEIILFFLKKNHLGQIGYFRPKKWWVPITLDSLKDFFFLKFWIILSPKMTRPQNFRSDVSIFSKFCSSKGTKRYMELILMVFLKKFSFEAIGPFWSENGMS